MGSCSLKSTVREALKASFKVFFFFTLPRPLTLGGAALMLCLHLGES